MPELTLAAPTAPAPLIHLCLNRAARKLLRVSRAWQEWLEPTDVTGAAFTEYTFELPQGGELVRLERATFDGRPIDLAHANDLPADPAAHAVRGRAYLVSQDLRSFTVGARAGAGAVQAFVSIIPTIRGNTVPDKVASLYHEAIRDGAKAELLATSGTDYYKPDQAAVALAFFNQTLDEATTDVWRSNTGSVPRRSPKWL